MSGPYRYLHFAGSDVEHPGISSEARRLHAAGYHAAGFISADLVDASGCISTEVDKTVGRDVRFYVAVDPRSDTNRATARVVLPFESYTDLPGYELCQGRLSDAGEELLSYWSRAGLVAEFSALSSTGAASARGILEVIRRMVHDGMHRGEVWFATLVVGTYESLIAKLGTRCMEVVGPDIPLAGPGIAAGLTLRPIVVMPQQVAAAIRLDGDESADPIQRRRLYRFAEFFEAPADVAPSTDAHERSEMTGLSLRGSL